MDTNVPGFIPKTFSFKTTFIKDKLQSKHTSEQGRVTALAQGHNNSPGI